jgi:hypothetical protein
VIAAELSFARAAQEKGQWTAFSESATGDAVMFVPQRVNAREWLRGRANPAQAVRWQPQQVWASCDGSLAVTKGPWQRADGSVGYFTTVWQRQSNGDYKWILDQGDTLTQPLAAAEMIAASAADCTPREAAQTFTAGESSWSAQAQAAGAVTGNGASRDGTLAYHYLVRPSGARETAVFMLKDGRMQEVMRSEVAAE